MFKVDESGCSARSYSALLAQEHELRMECAILESYYTYYRTRGAKVRKSNVFSGMVNQLSEPRRSLYRQLTCFL